MNPTTDAMSRHDAVRSAEAIVTQSVISFVVIHSTVYRLSADEQNLLGNLLMQTVQCAIRPLTNVRSCHRGTEFQPLPPE